MSGGQERTEQPTPKKLAKAREDGQVAKSTDLNSALIIGGVAIVFNVYGAYFGGYLVRLCREYLGHQLRHPAPITLTSFLDMYHILIWHIALILLPFLLCVMTLGLLANFLQVRWLFTLKPLKPSWSKLNPKSGFKRMFSQKSLVELAKGILKMVVVGSVAWYVIQGQQSHLMSMSRMGFMAAWLMVFNIMIQITTAIALAFLVMGLADFWYAKYNHTKQLRMTKQEVKDEMKNTEGNPEIKRKVRSAGQQIARQRMLQAVPTADVIVTNPTHFAVAIQYDPDVAPAPRVVAKGTDHMAFRIRELAKEHGVPIVENKPLARSMYAAVEVNHMIPPELFIGVAEVLAYVFRKNKGRYRSRMRRNQNSGGRVNEAL